MTPGLVSTIIPVYNRPVQLAEAVVSVLEQDYRPIEVIIVDDGSTDGATLQGAHELAAGHLGLVRVATQANSGPGAARERGRLMAQGEYIQYLDSDDLLLPGKFNAQVQALRSHPTSDVAYGMTRYRHADGTVAPGPWKGSGVERPSMFPSFLNERWWDTSTPLYRATICEKAGAWSNLRLEEDWEYDCRIAAQGAQLVWCNQYVCEVRDHAGDRLCRGTVLDVGRQQQRAVAQERIFRHAQAYGLTSASPEMQAFSRSLFLLARQCGAAGLPTESRRLFGLAREAAGGNRARRIDFRLYAVLASSFGWVTAGKISGWLDAMRRTP